MSWLDRLHEEWERNPSARRVDLFVFPVFAVLIVGGFIVAIASPRFAGIGRMIAALSLLLIVAINYAVRRSRQGR